MMRKNQHWIITVVLVVGFLVGGATPVGYAQSKGQDPVDIAAYVPLDGGRTWTYQWTVQYRDGRKETSSHTKSFEGPEFLSTGYAYRFMSDLGDYVLLSVENQQLRMHGSVEPSRNIRFAFDPPVVLYSQGMEFNRPYAITQEAEDGSGPRTWTTVIEGIETADTPMGKFGVCLKIRLEMTSAIARTKTVYYYARGIGLVAYQYEAWTGKNNRAEIAIDAGLKLAQVSGRTITSVSQLEILNTKVWAAANRPDQGDPDARRAFRQAYEKLYFWPAKFPGFLAEFTVKQGSDPTAMSMVSQGTVAVTSDLKMKVTGSIKAASVQVESEVSQLITHLKEKPFDSQYKDATFAAGDTDASKGARIDLYEDHSMGTSYRIKEGEISQISHSYGRVRFLVNHANYMRTEEGLLIPTSFSIMYYSNETDQIIDQVDYRDEYTRVDGLWLPKRRFRVETTKGTVSAMEIEFKNHQALN